MAATTTELMVRLVADTKGFAAELGGATQDIDKLHAKAVRMGTAMQDVGRRMTLGFTVPFVAGMGLAVKAASDLEQAVGATESVFGPAAAEVERYAKRAVDAVGLSERAYRELAAVSGAQFKNLGLSQREAAKESDRLIKIGADLAATFGGTTADAVNALQAAFRGEADPAERFGLRLNINTVNAKALEMGLAKTTSEVSNHARQQATMALIVEQSAGALGQFQRESGTAAVQMQKARAEIENAGAALGSALLPMVADVAGAIAGLAQWFANLPGPIKSVIIILGGLVAAAGPVLWVTGSMVKNVGALVQAFPQLRTAAVGAFSALGAASGPALVVGITAIGVALAQSTHKSLDYEKATRAIVRANDEAQASMFMQTAMVARLTDGLNGIIAPHRLFAEVLEQGVGPAQRLIDNLQAAGYNTKAFEKALRDEVAAQKQANADSERGAAILSDLGTEATDTAASIDDLRTAFDDLTNAQFDVEGSAISMERAIQNLDEAVRDGKDGTLEGRQAFLDAKRGIEDWGQAVFDNAKKAGKETSDASAEQQWALGQVAGSLAPGSPLRQWLDQYINDLNRIPGNVGTIITIAGRTYNIQPEGYYDPTAVPGLATGGWVPPSPGGTVIRAGEGGEGEFVIPGSKIGALFNRMSGTQSAGPQTIVIPVHVGGRQVAEVVASELNRPGGPKITQKALVA